MPAAVRRSYVTVGVALVGASVITATPIEPPPTDMRVASAEVRLAASVADIANVPANLFSAIASIPANEVQALDRFADAMLATGSWDVWSPTNVFGFDAVDRERLKAIVDLMVPFPALSSVIGEWLSVWSQANLPMNAGCAALPGACPDPAAMLNSMFQVSVLQLFTGYTFPEVVNPFDGSHPEWSEQHVDLDPLEPFTAVMDYLLAPPSEVETVSLEQTLATFAKLAQSLWVGFYPFVQDSEWFNPDTTGFAYLFRPLAPVLCQDCDPDSPYDSPWLYENYDPHYPSSTPTPGQTDMVNVANIAVGDGVANGEAAEDDSAVADPVNGTDVTLGVAEQSLEPGNQAQFVDGQESSLPAADLSIAPDGVETFTSEPADASGGTADGTMPTEREKDGNKVVPGGRHRMPGDGDLNRVKSVPDKVNATVSRIADSLGGQTAVGGEDTGEGTGGTGEQGS